MEKILALTDYKGNFGSKWDAIPYRGGMNLMLIKNYFSEIGYDIEYKKLSEIKFTDCHLKNYIILYTSSEDWGYKYKTFIEDIILGLEELDIKVVPAFKFLRANNNKVFMEILRDILIPEKDLISSYYGTLEELNTDKLKYPVVLKKSHGAMSNGVFLAYDKKGLVKLIKRINANSNLLNIKEILKDFFRPFRHKFYKKESLHRNKFIIQKFIPKLKSDYKVLIFGERYYIFERPVRINDFRASGSGSKNYIFGSYVNYPEKIFDYAKQIFDRLKVPHLSLDIAYNGKKFLLFEFQAIYFGTIGQYKSDGYYINYDNNWIFIPEILDLEKVYVDSIQYFLSRDES